MNSTVDNSLAGSLIALDVDGTLLRPDGSVSARTVDAIGQAKAAGASLTLATGRDWHAVSGLLEHIPTIDHALCINGIEVFDRGGIELYAGSLDPIVARRAVEALRVAIPGIAVGAGMAGQLIGEPGVTNAMPPGLAGTIEVDDIVGQLGPGLRDLVLFHPQLSLDLKRFHDAVTTELSGHEGVEVAFTGLPMIEITPPGSGKHTGLAWLAGHLAVQQARVVAFGDGYNDLTMLAWAGTGVAMGQAVDDVKAVANHVTLSAAEDGIAHWIDQALAQQAR